MTEEEEITGTTEATITTIKRLRGTITDGIRAKGIPTRTAMTIEENTVIGIGITAGVGIAGIGITVGVMIAIEGIIIGIDTTTGIAITATAVMPVIMTVISAPPSESIDDGFGDGVAFGRH